MNKLILKISWNIRFLNNIPYLNFHSPGALPNLRFVRPSCHSSKLRNAICTRKYDRGKRRSVSFLRYWSLDRNSISSWMAGSESNSYLNFKWKNRWLIFLWFTHECTNSDALHQCNQHCTHQKTTRHALVEDVHGSTVDMTVFWEVYVYPWYAG